MKAKLIKTEVNYILEDDKGVVIASTSLKKDGLALSLKNCQAIERGYDLDELAIESSREYFIKPIESPIFTFGYEEGFQKALEILGDKKFSEEDISKAYQEGYYDELSLQEVIQSLRQTEWEVEVVMQKIKDETKIIGSVKGVKGSGSKITTYKSVPKLDADGCLILKRL